MLPPFRNTRLANALGHVRDILVIAFIVGADLYVLNHPEKIDAFLDWILRRN
jgi:hypothetical protein